MPKIVFANRYFAPDESATSQLLRDLATDLATRDEDVHVVCSRQLTTDPSSALPAEEEIQGVKVHRIWTTRFGRHNLAGRFFDYLTFGISAFLYLVRLLRAGDIVVAKTDPPILSLVATIAAKLRRAQTVNWLQDVFPEIAAQLGMSIATGLPGAVLTRLRDWSLNHAAANVVIGEMMAEHLITRGIDRSKLHVIPNWSDGEQIFPVPREMNQLRECWGLRDKFVVGYSGNMGRAHELETIINAATLLNDNEEIVFLLIGGGTQLREIQREVESRRLRNVVFQPYQEKRNLGLSLTVPDIHFASLKPELEGLIVPSKFYGVAAAGRATLWIGDANGEVGRLIEDADCGRTVWPGDSTGLAKHIQMLAIQPALTLEMGARARALFNSRFERKIQQRRWSVLLSGLRHPKKEKASANSTKLPRI